MNYKIGEVEKMIPAEVNIQIDEKAIREHIENRLDEVINESILLVDVKGLAKRLSMSERYIEDQFLKDPRIRQHEVRKNQKRWYFYKPVMQEIEKIIKSEW